MAAYVAGIEAGGPALQAIRDHERRGHAKDIDDELTNLRASLARLARKATAYCPEWRDPRYMTTPKRELWSRLQELELAAAAFESSFRAPKPEPSARGRGQRADADASGAMGRVVRVFFDRFCRRVGTPHELALTEIALEFAPTCDGAEMFAARRDRWSKALASSRKRARAE